MNKKLTAAILASLTLAATTSVFAAPSDSEIQDLKLRIAALENSKQPASKITITGESRLRYQSSDEDHLEGTNQFDLRQRLYLKAKINDQVSYTGRLEANFKTGTSNGDTRFNQNYFTVKDFGVDTMLIGRVPAAAGMNMNVSKPGDNDGVVLVQKAGEVTLTGFILDEAKDTQFNGIYAGMNVGKNTDVAIGYTKGDAIVGTAPEAKSLDIGVYTKLGDDISLVGTYVDTNNTGAADADAWALQVVKGVTTKKVGTLSTNMSIVDKSKPNTSGYMLGYRRVEANGLWNKGVAAPFNSSAAYSSTVNNITDDVKGLYLGYQNVLAKNTVLTLEYQDLEKVSNGADVDKLFTTHVQFYF